MKNLGLLILLEAGYRKTVERKPWLQRGIYLHYTRAEAKRMALDLHEFMGTVEHILIIAS